MSIARNSGRAARVSRRMVPKRALTLGVVPAFAWLVMLAAPATTLADCAMPPDIKSAVVSADNVFVGTVTATSNRGTWATVTVEEVWRGPDQPAEVVVQGGPPGNAATSVDRSFDVGRKYIFVPMVDAQGALTDNACTSTTQWFEDLVQLRPATARSPLAGGTASSGFDFSGVLGPVVVAVVVSAVLLAVGLLARSRQPG